ncbi:MAG TPA: hypothetical protein PKY13_13820 [Microthrixaceae bacterium]|mgnify:CR=1 FL=1|jgi:hypothetical protein|nr:hypothetical protein [Microthrixaceae bacterium]
MSDEPSTSRVAPIVGVIVGLPLLVVGVLGAVADGDRTKPFELARWVVGADLAHDLVLAPVVVGVSWLVGRIVPPVARGPVRWAAATTGVLCLIAWPFVRGYGRNETVPSLLDRNYATGLAAYVAAIWFLALIWIAVRRARHSAPAADGEG